MYDTNCVVGYFSGFIFSHLLTSRLLQFVFFQQLTDFNTVLFTPDFTSSWGVRIFCMILICGCSANFRKRKKWASVKFCCCVCQPCENQHKHMFLFWLPMYTWQCVSRCVHQIYPVIWLLLHCIYNTDIQGLNRTHFPKTHNLFSIFEYLTILLFCFFDRLWQDLIIFNNIWFFLIIQGAHH